MNKDANYSSLENNRGYEWDGKYLQIQNPAKLPEVCINCGNKEGLSKFHEVLTYVNPMVLLWIFLTPIALLIAYGAYKKQVAISFFRCSSCASKKGKWAKIAMISWLVFAASIVVRFVFGKPFIELQAVLLLGSPLIALFATAMKDNQFSVKKVVYPIFYVKGINSEVKSELTKVSN